MRRAIWIGVGLAAILAACGGSSSTSNAPRISSSGATSGGGDVCLVGQWVLRGESGSLNSAGTVWMVTGLAGATTTISDGGLETLNYEKSEPLIISSDKGKISSVYRGTLTRQIKAKDGVITASETKGEGSVTSTVGGMTTTTPLHLKAASLSYTCSEQDLQWREEAAGVSATDTFKRG